MKALKLAMSRRLFLLAMVASGGFLMKGRAFSADAGPPQTLSLKVGSPIDSLVPEDPVKLRTVATETVQQCADIAEATSVLEKHLASSNKAIDQGKSDIDQLTQTKEAVLDEMRRGFYCSKCMRSRLEIEQQDHEDFYVHLARVGGHVVPAPTEAVLARAKQFNDRLAALSTDQTLRIANRDRLVKRLGDMFDQFPKGVELWRWSLSLQRQLIDNRYARANDLDMKLYGEYDALALTARGRLLSLAQHLHGADHLEAQLEALRQYQDLADSADAAKSKLDYLMKTRAALHNREIAAADADRRNDEKTLSRCIGAMTHAPDYSVQLPPFSIDVAGASVSLSGQDMAASFQLDKVVSIAIDEDFDRDEKSATTTGTLRLFDKLGVFLAQTTRYDSVEGVITTRTVGVDLGPFGKASIGEYPDNTTLPARPPDSIPPPRSSVVVPDTGFELPRL